MVSKERFFFFKIIPQTAKELQPASQVYEVFCLVSVMMGVVWIGDLIHKSRLWRMAYSSVTRLTKSPSFQMSRKHIILNLHSIEPQSWPLSIFRTFFFFLLNA